jgi:hypothetical protein
MQDPCDGWQYPAANPRYVYLADRPQIVCFEGFTPQNATPDLAKFLPFVRTDFSHWSHDLEWTLESGPDDAPSSVDVLIPYNYRGGSADTYSPIFGAVGGDAAEVEIGTAMYFNAAGEWCEVNLTEAETERVETWIHENPPEVDSGDDW